MDVFKPERKYFKYTMDNGSIKENIENVTANMEKRKHQLMIEKLKDLEEKIKLDLDMSEYDEDVNMDAYEFDNMMLNNMLEEKVADTFTLMLAVEKILDSLGIENYRLGVIKNSVFDEEVEEIFEEDEEDTNIEILDEEEDEEEIYNDDNEYMNMYKYNDEFYVIDIATDMKKKQMILAENDIVQRRPFEIGVEFIIDNYVVEVLEKTKNNGKAYIEHEKMDIMEFLYSNLKQEKKYNKEIEEK